MHAHDLHPNKISEWKKRPFENAANVFAGARGQADAFDLVPLHTKIRQQALELDPLNSAFTNDRKASHGYVDFFACAMFKSQGPKARSS